MLGSQVALAKLPKGKMGSAGGERINHSVLFAEQASSKEEISVSVRKAILPIWVFTNHLKTGLCPQGAYSGPKWS